MKYTLITGASSGIGEAFSRRLAAEKHNVFLVARSEDKLRDLCDELAQRYGISAKYLAVDLIEVDSDFAVFEATEKNDIEIDWLINNAGFGSMGDFAKLDLERELEMIELNITAVVALTHHYLQKMRERGSGTIINVSSGAGFQPIPFFATYSATKAFVTSFTEAIAEENRPYGIRVLALCPGATDTGFFEASGIDDPMMVKGFQTAEQVVDAALSALKRGRTKIVSGWINYLAASAVNVLPNSLITRVAAKPLRKRYQKAEPPA